MPIFRTPRPTARSRSRGDGFRRLAGLGLAALLGLGLGGAGANEGAAATADEGAGARTGEQAGAGERYKRLIVEAGRQLQQGAPARTLELLQQASQLLGGKTTPDILFLAAQAYAALGDRARAAQVLGALAKRHPEVDRLQLDYAALLYSVGRDEEADEIFRDIRARKDLPEAVRRNVEEFLHRIHRRRSLLIDYDFSVWKDDNINNATEVEEVQVPLFGNLSFTPDEKPIEAWVVRTGVRLFHRLPLREDGGMQLHSRASLTRNTARGAKAHTRTWLNLSVGPQWHYLLEREGRSLPGVVGADLGYEKRWRNGGDSYSGSAWLRLSLRQRLSGSWSAGGHVRYWDTDYSEASGDQEPTGQELNLFAQRLFPNARVTAGWTVSTEHPERASQRWKSHQGLLGYETVLGVNWRLATTVTLAEIRYRGIEPLFQRRRKDQRRTFSVTVSNRAFSWEGYLPELTLGFAETKSNIDLYDRDNFNLRLGFQKLF